MEQKSIVITCAKINNDETMKMSATQLRGYIGHLFIQDTEFHHHDDNPYRYPLIQYKKIMGNLYVMGINEYSSTIVEKISDLKEIILPHSKVNVTSVEITTISTKITDEITRYKFQTPWIALNSKNYEKFKTVEHDIKLRFLESILIGNLLSAAKGMNIQIEHKLYANIIWYKSRYVIAHKNPFQSFHAQFATNLRMPDMIGIGNSVSKGFGVITRI